MDTQPSGNPPPVGAREEAPPSEPGSAAKPPGRVRTNWRERAAARFGSRPLLRTFTLNPWFTILSLSVLGTALLLLVSVPKVWRTTPAGFQPAVRISLLDLVQSFRCEQNARAHLAQGNSSGARREYSEAVSNNPGNAPLIRRALESFLQPVSVDGDAEAERAGELATWLLRLTDHDEPDVVLAARVFDRLGDFRSVVRLLEGFGAALPDEAAGPMARARFQVAGGQELATWWLKWGRAADTSRAMALYRAAWKAGWGAGREAAAGQAQLEEATAALDQRLLANRLLLRVATQRADPHGYEEVLRRLEGFQGDRLQDHVDYWLMLQQSGRGEEARGLAVNHPYPPRTPMEAASMGRALISLGDPVHARRFLQRHAPVLGDGPAAFCLPLWVMLGDLHAEARCWPELVQMGKDLRILQHGDAALRGFGWFVEGCALAQMGDRGAAVQAFDAALALDFVAPRMSLELAAVWIRTGFPEHAGRALLPLEDELGDNAHYWTTLFQATYALRQDEALLFKAARRALDLAPTDPACRMDYAAALFVNRQRPEETAEIAADFLRRNADVPAARLVRAGALALAGCTNDARVELDRLPVLTEAGLRTARAMVELDIALADNDPGMAWAALARIDEALLFPRQIAWLAGVRERIGDGSTD